jgi:hypothetical protein
LVTGIILLAFAYAYFVQGYKDSHENDDYDSFGGSFLTVFGAFVSGPERPETLVDILFAILSVVILLNVVIAIVSNAWDDSTEATTNRFWEYRLNFIEEVAYTEEFLANIFGKCIFWRRSGERDDDKKKRGKEEESLPKSDNQSEPGSSSSHTSVFFHVQNHLNHPDNVIKPELGGWERFWFVVAYIVLFALGLCSFGQCWPKCIRKDVFGRNKGTPVKEKTPKPESLSETKHPSPAAGDSGTIHDIQKSIQKLDDRKVEERITK